MTKETFQKAQGIQEHLFYLNLTLNKIKHILQNAEKDSFWEPRIRCCGEEILITEEEAKEFLITRKKNIEKAIKELENEFASL